MFLIDDILLAPITGFQFIMRTLARVAEEQWTDDAPLKEQLLALQVQLENGQITEEQYVELEAAILRELRAVQERKIQMAGGEVPDASQGLSGKVAEGSGATATLTYEIPEEPKR
jgi:gas vesicle protein GvpG